MVFGVLLNVKSSIGEQENPLWFLRVKCLSSSFLSVSELRLTVSDRRSVRTPSLVSVVQGSYHSVSILPLYLLLVAPVPLLSPWRWEGQSDTPSHSPLNLYSTHWSDLLRIPGSDVSTSPMIWETSRSVRTTYFFTSLLVSSRNWGRLSVMVLGHDWTNSVSKSRRDRLHHRWSIHIDEFDLIYLL